MLPQGLPAALNAAELQGGAAGGACPVKLVNSHMLAAAAVRHVLRAPPQWKHTNPAFTITAAAAAAERTDGPAP
jgi:hypothetical protein